MIRFSLTCPDHHAFDSWFADGAAFEALQKAGHLTCPDCGSTNIRKALMAPAVVQTRKSEGPSAAEAEDRAALIAEMRRQIEANSDYVGNEFVAEARKMHLGETEERSIYGEADLEEAKELLEEGIPVLPLPFTPSRKVN